jgi:hypothetical protein
VAKRWRRKAADDDGVLFTSGIDMLAVKLDPPAAVLVVTVDQPWTGSHAQFMSLAQKIRNYTQFVLSGQMEQDYPDTVGLPWRVEIVTLVGDPDPVTAELLPQLVDHVRECGGGWVLRHLGRPPQHV